MEEAKKVKSVHPLAVEGSRTKRGGVVRVQEREDHIYFGEGRHRLAHVGDEVVYPDGSVSCIVSGAGYGFAHRGFPAAIIGSEAENGDVIEWSPDTGIAAEIHVPEEGIEGLLVRGYSAPWK